MKRSALALCSVAAAVSTVLTTSAVSTAAGSATAARAVTVVASGLNNPRGLVFVNGVLYVAEAGAGGGACMKSAYAEPPGSEICYGATGALARIVNGKAQTIVGNLASASGPGGFAATGPDGLAAAGTTLYTPITYSPEVAPSQDLPAPLATLLHNQFGRLLAYPIGGATTAVADVGGFDYTWSNLHKSADPGQFPDANPYGVVALGDGIEYVADAGSNTVDLVNKSAVAIRGYIPNPKSSDAVPTCVVARDGVLYVGELAGVGNPPGSANIWQITPGHEPALWKSGFTSLTSCTFAPNGTFYATEFQTAGFTSSNPAGDVVKITPAGQVSHLGVGSLDDPGGVTVGPNGMLYVSNWSIAPGNDAHGPVGQIVTLAG